MFLRVLFLILLKVKIQYYITEDKLLGFSLMSFLKKSKPWPCEVLPDQHEKDKGRWSFVASVSCDSAILLVLIASVHAWVGEGE